MSEPQMQGLTFPLRSGESCVLQGETLVIGQRQIPLRDIVSAELVADTSVVVPPGMPPTPGVSLWLRDGGIVAFTPVEQLGCWRLLNALAAARPELATPLPPPPGSSGLIYGPSYGYNPGYGYHMAGPTETDKTLAGVCHLSIFFAPVILPLIIWLAMSKSQPYASSQAKQAFFFHLAYSALAVIVFIGMEGYAMFGAFSFASAGGAATPATIDSTLLPIFLMGYGALGVVWIIEAVFSIIAAVAAFQGKPYHYPLLGWLRA